MAQLRGNLSLTGLTMVAIDEGKAFESWNDRVRAGRDHVPGGLH